MPVVVTTAGGSVDAVNHGQSGYLVEKTKESEIAERLIDVVQNLPKWRLTAASGPKFIREKFSVAQMVDGTLASQFAKFPLAESVNA